MVGGTEREKKSRKQSKGKMTVEKEEKIGHSPTKAKVQEGKDIFGQPLGCGDQKGGRDSSKKYNFTTRHDISGGIEKGTETANKSQYC